MFKKVCIFSGNANPALAQEIAQVLEMPLGQCRVSRFSDGETFCEIHENVRGVDTYIIQPTCSPVNDNVMELLIMADALRRASAGSITAVIPYYGYARQDRKVAPRTPITSKLCADLIVAAGVNRVVCVDLHAGQIQGFFNIPFDHLFAHAGLPRGLPAKELRQRRRASSRPTRAASSARAPTRSASTPRWPSSTSAASAPTRARSCTSSATSKGKDCIIVDDLIDTAGTLCNAARALKAQGAKRVVGLRHPRRPLRARRAAHRGFSPRRSRRHQ